MTEIGLSSNFIEDNRTLVVCRNVQADRIEFFNIIYEAEQVAYLAFAPTANASRVRVGA